MLTGADKALGSVGSLGINLENPAVIPSGRSSRGREHGPKIKGNLERRAGDPWHEGPIVNKVLKVFFNRFKPFPDTIHVGGVDFIPVIDHPAQWRVSTVVRDRIFLNSRDSISSDLTKEGKP